MAGNTFGTLFRITTFGESHGPAIGGILEGCPAGLTINIEEIQRDLDRRRPGQSELTSPRKEDDQVEVLSGVFEGKSTGTPIGFLIRNKDQKSADYSHLKDKYRPSHADFTYDKKYGFRDHRGGGRSSARETACRVAAGSIAKQFLAHSNVTVKAFVKQVGDISVTADDSELNLDAVYDSDVRCPHESTALKMTELIKKVTSEGDTVGGVIRCLVQGHAAGLGEPVFDKLPALLAHAMMSINAVKGFEIGSGFSSAFLRGSQHNDAFTAGTGREIRTVTNNSGGVQGGITNGMPVTFNVAFKPVATIMQAQQTIDREGAQAMLEGKGRHDACVLPRAVPIVEAMAALVMADMLLLQRASRL